MWEAIKGIVGFASLKELLDVVLVPLTVALLVPWIARRWQERQRDLEIKTELVAEISGLVMTTVMTMYLFRAGHTQRGEDKDSQQAELLTAYKKWRVETCIIGSKLHAYFPDPSKGERQIHKKWRHFSDRLTQYYESASDVANKSDADRLEKEREELFEEKAAVIQEILRSKVSGFHQREIQEQTDACLEI